MGNDKSKGYMNSATSTDKDELDTTMDKLKSFDVSVLKIYPIKLNGKEKNQQKLVLPKELIIEMAINYLEIRDIYKLANTCKLMYSWLFSDSNEFWRRIGNRDGFTGKSGVECQQIYANIWKQSLDFENHQYFDNYLQSKNYTYSNSRSYNYESFMKFLDGINRDINQMVYVLRNPKRNIILKAYIAVYGLVDIEKGEELDKKLEKLISTLCYIEDGTNFEAIFGWQSTKICNLLSVAMEKTFESISSPDVKERIEELFLRTAAFRVDCSGFTKYYRYAEGQLSGRATKILSNRYSSRETNPKWGEYYDLLLKVLTTPEMRKTIHNSFCLEDIVRYFQSFKKEESIEVLIDLLRCDEPFDEKTIAYYTLKNLNWHHPRLFEELMNERYFSISPYSYVSLIGTYIYTDQHIDLEVRKRALNYISNVCNNEKSNSDVANTFIYYLPWKRLKESSNFEFKEFREEALAELKKCSYHMWAFTHKVSFLPVLKDFYAEDGDRFIDQLLTLRPPSGRDCHYTVEEAFKILKEHSEKIPPEQKDSYFSRLIQFLESYILHADLHNNDLIFNKHIVNAAEWIHPYCSIESLYETMKKQAEVDSFIRYYIKNIIPQIEAILKSNNQEINI